MKAARYLFLAALAFPMAQAQLTVTRVQNWVRDPYHFTDMAVADLDGDGDQDLLLQGLANRLTCWSENRAGSFARPVVIEMAPRTHNGQTPDLADLEGDGRKDLYLEGNQTRTRNLGGGSFSTPEPLPGRSWPVYDPEADPETYDNALAPLPGANGRDKLFIARVATWDHFTQLLFLTPGPTGEIEERPLLVDGSPLTFEATAIDNSDGPRWVDTDRDGDADMVYYNGDTGDLRVYRNRGNDQFDAPVEAAGGAMQQYFKPATLAVPGRELPSLVYAVSYFLEEEAWQEEFLTIRGQTSDESGFHFEPENPAHRISLNDDSLQAMLVLPAPDGSDELWLRVTPDQSQNDFEEDRVRAYRYDPVSGWEKFVDQPIAGRGYGNMELLRLTPGGPEGLAFRMGGEGGVNFIAEDKVVWASLDSLRSGTPAWQTIAGPFNDFKALHLADLDRDGKLDLLSGERDHGMTGGRSGRFHLIYDLEGHQDRRLVDVGPAVWHEEVFPMPGNRAAIGDLDGDELPELALTNAPGNTLYLLKNLGTRTFAPPELRASSEVILAPHRLSPGQLLYQDGGRLFTQGIPAGAPPLPSHDLGTTGIVVYSDMDGDGDRDLIAYPCPLGMVTGWGKTDPAGTVISWHFLSSAPAYEIRAPETPPGLGWITAGANPEFKRVREGVPGVASSPMPLVPSASDKIPLWPPVDLDRDGDFDLLFLVISSVDSFGGNGARDLVWHENRGTGWNLHAQALVPVFFPSSNGWSTSLQVIEDPDKCRIVLGTGQGEVFQLDFAAPMPGGGFGAWLASFGLSGASAGAESDADGDGLTNLEEALQGTSPVAANEGSFRIPVSLDSAGGWSFTSAMALAGTGVKAVAEASDDMEEWTVLPDEVELNGENAGRFLYQVADENISGEKRRFVRFKFTWTAD